MQRERAFDNGWISGDLSCAPVLCLVSDQGSTLFAAQNNMLYGERKLRAIWFPGWNHQAHNIDAGVLRPLGMSQVDDKMRFISKMRYGPKRSPGAWNGQLRSAMEVTHYDDNIEMSLSSS